MKIAAEPLIKFDNGRAIWLAAEAGEVPALHMQITPEGNRVVEQPDPFKPGALMLTGTVGTTIVGPVDYAQVLDYARLTIMDSPRVRTRSSVMLMLAAALLALDHETNGPRPTCPCGDNDGLWCSLPGCPYPKPTGKAA